MLTYPRAFEQFSSSPFCTKAAYLLTLAQVRWEREDTVDPRRLPYGKLPAIRLESGTIIADSDAIRIHLEQNGARFESGLTELDRANARAFIRMAEEHIYFHIFLDRWGNDAVWPEIRDTYFAAIPPVLRGMIANRLRRKVLAGLHTQGVGRLPENERITRLETDLDAITTRLWHGEYLFGETLSAADASVAPMLSSALATPGDTRLKRLVAQNEVLTGYVARVEDAMTNAGCA